MKWLRRIIAKPWSAIIGKHLYSLVGVPYFRVILFHYGRMGEVGIDAHYNIHFLYHLDNAYQKAGSTHYKKEMDEQAKIAIYMYDSIAQVAEQYMPLPAEMVESVLDELGNEAPGMPLTGGEPVRQVVDLAVPSDGSMSATLDIETG